MALFCNNVTATASATCSNVDGWSSEGLPVPVAVNSLGWSSVEERLFTGDAVGFVRASSKHKRLFFLVLG